MQKKQTSPEKGRKELKSAKKLTNVHNFGIFFWQHIKNLFVAVTQCDNMFCLFFAVIQCNKQNFVCLSDSVQQTILTKNLYLLVASDKGIEKSQKKKKNPSKFEFHQRYQIALGYIKVHFAM